MTALAELTSKLKEIFQIDRADLDFGIYRILNSRNEQITHYLNHTLPKNVAEKLAKDGDMETAVYRHLLTFFSRYYEEGDFISQRRYKGDTYAIPYNGEEVMLHWANKDQYYTKSGENFTNYRFDLADGRQVFFKLNTADTAKDNQKDNEAKRFFTLASPQIDDNENTIFPISESESDDGKVLTILFDYKAFPKSAKPTQDKILADDLATIFANEIVATNWQLLTEKSPTEKNKERTLLEKHLSDYTAKNTADYFIHKDLGGFLKRELDFYIKNEVMNLDDIDNVSAFADIENNLRLIQTLRHIAHDIITFLAQLENFQKRLWEKKKFVADCHYLITLDNIDKRFHAEIFANQKQLDEWQNLYGADNIQRENAHLVVNTSLFSQSFQAKLLGGFDELDNQIDGTIIHSDNFQALNLLQAKYQGQVKCIYIDPPYNTESNPIIYKNNYKHSTWLSLIESRLLISKNYERKNDGIHIIAIDKEEKDRLQIVASEILSHHTCEPISVIHNPGGTIGRNFSTNGEYSLFFINDEKEVLAKEIRNDNPDIRDLMNTAKGASGNYLRKSGKTCFYAILVKGNDIIGFGDVCDNDFHPQRNVHRDDGIIEVYPIDNDGVERKWVLGRDTVEKHRDELFVKNDKKNGVVKIERRKNKLNFKSIWTDSKYSAKKYGTELLGNIIPATRTMERIYPKSIYLVLDCIFAGLNNNKNEIVLDYFAGSGTTAHAVINLNREDGGNRKFILVEQGEYFDTVLKPRIQKVIFAKDYKDGKPVADKDGQFGGISQIVKVLKLESYEDTLNNLVLYQSDLLGNLPQNAQKDYLLNYMLDIESRESLLNVADFTRPFDYELNISANSTGAFVRQKIDLVETFNYLIGATVLGIDDRRDGKGYVEIECRLPHQNDDERTLIFWRDCDKLGYDELKAMFVARNINPRESIYQEIYINGDHTLDTVWESADGVQSTLKVKSIEQEFLTLMFGAI